MMNKSLRLSGRESSGNRIYGFQRMGAQNSRAAHKKEPPFPAAFEVDNREASNRVDRSHSASKRGHHSHRCESLMDRKRPISFSFRLPCQPVAERLFTRTRSSSIGPRAPVVTARSVHAFQLPPIERRSV